MSLTATTYKQMMAKIAALERERDLSLQSARNSVGSLAAVRNALGKPNTNYLYIADDVAALVKRVEVVEPLNQFLTQTLVDIAVKAKLMDEIRRTSTLSELEIRQLSVDLVSWSASLPRKGRQVS